MIYADSSLTSTRPGKQNRGNYHPQRRQRQRTRTSPDRARSETLGPYTLRGLGDGSGSLPWQSFVLAEQLHHPRQWSPWQRLMEAVLQDAVEQYQHHKMFPTRKGAFLFREVAAWFASEDERYIFSFVNICHALGLDVGYVRAGVRGK